MSEHASGRFERAVAAIDELMKEAPASKRVDAASTELSEFMLTGASEAIRESIEACAMRYNQLMQAAREAEGAEDASMSESDAAELAAQLLAACELVRSTETEHVLSRLRNHEGRLPEDEVKLIRRHPDWFAPLLLQECIAETEKLEQWGDTKQTSGETLTSSLPFLAFFIASELGLAEFVPVVLRGIALPEELPEELYGDAIHQLLPRFLAQFLHDDLQRIDDLILHEAHDLYVRWTAAGSYAYLVRDNRITREAAVERLDRLFEATKVFAEDGRPGSGHPYELSAGIADTIASIGGGALSSIGDAEEHWQFIDDCIITVEEFLESNGSTNPTAPEISNRKLPPTQVEDCLRELRDWAAFDRSALMAENATPFLPPSARPKPQLHAKPSRKQPVQKPAPSSERTPRNAACPCGSGKKYKKCCLQA